MGSEAVEELVIRCLQMPLRGGLRILVPNTTVAEVTVYHAPEPMQQAPAWLLGTVMWRGASIPMVSFEQMLGREETMHSPQRRIAVMNTLRNDSLLPFFAIEIQGIPRLVQAREDTMELSEGEAGKFAMVASDVVIDGKTIMIPDLEVIEKMLLQMGIKVH